MHVRCRPDGGCRNTEDPRDAVTQPTNSTWHSQQTATHRVPRAQQLPLHACQLPPGWRMQGHKKPKRRSILLRNARNQHHMALMALSNSVFHHGNTAPGTHTLEICRLRTTGGTASDTLPPPPKKGGSAAAPQTPRVAHTKMPQ